MGKLAEVCANNLFTFHIVNLKRATPTPILLKFGLFTFHIVNLKLM
ncbi:hypothetical protein QU3_1613 [Clostridioides difficile P42]|nr:hypothetical protein QU3_1613 [Clostridioides difficile P42]